MNAAADLVIAAARVWLGTPYVHQASVLGAGCDCLGLARGVWRDVHGPEPVTPPPYTRDWGEAGGEEVLAEAARRFLLEVPIATARPGALMLFRMSRNAPAKHCGICSATGLIHAYEGAGGCPPWHGSSPALFVCGGAQRGISLAAGFFTGEARRKPLN